MYPKTIHHRLVDADNKVLNTGGVTIMWEQVGDPDHGFYAYGLAFNPYGSTWIPETRAESLKLIFPPNNYDKKLGRAYATERLIKAMKLYNSPGSPTLSDVALGSYGVLKSDHQNVITDLLKIAEFQFFKKFKSQKVKVKNFNTHGAQAGEVILRLPQAFKFKQKEYQCSNITAY